MTAISYSHHRSVRSVIDCRTTRQVLQRGVTADSYGRDLLGFACSEFVTKPVLARTRRRRTPIRRADVRKLHLSGMIFFGCKRFS